MKKIMVELTKEISFEAAHYLHNPKWGREKNLVIFKKCSGFRLDDSKAVHYPHGHSYRLRVTVQGPIQPETGFVMNFKILKEILKREVFAQLDHRFINHEVEPFKSDPVFQTTVENLLVVIWEKLEPVLKKEKVVLSELTLWETASNSATLRK
jgi:6-pyruvoyltetrahydropterin/6-carboxytetrahydropterin synthase